MRNLIMFPITEEEKLSKIQELLDDWLKSDQISYGDLTGAILTRVLEDLRNYYDMRD